MAKGVLTRNDVEALVAIKPEGGAGTLALVLLLFEVPTNWEEDAAAGCDVVCVPTGRLCV